MSDSFTMLGSDDLVLSDTDHTTSDDMTDDELWSDDDTVIDDTTLWDSTRTIPVDDVSTDDGVLSQSETLALLNNNRITTNEILENIESTNEITANEVSPDRLLESYSINNKTIPTESPSVLLHDESLEDITQELTCPQGIDDNSPTVSFLSRMSSQEDVNTCFDELADLLSSPEAMIINNTSSCDPSPVANNMLNQLNGYSNKAIEDQCSLSAITTSDSSTQVDDSCVAEDFDWN